MSEAEHFHHPPFRLAHKSFSFTMPRNWEVSAFQFLDNTGLYLFSSEAGAHGQFTFRPFDGMPDIPRIIEEIHRREMNLEAPPKLKFTRYGENGAVTLAHTKPGERFYASAFNPAERLLNEWIFPHWSESAVQEVLPMLESYTANPQENGRRFYAMFGLEVSVPEEYHLRNVEAYPGAVSLNFETKKHYRLETHRWGMAQLLLQGADTLNYYHRYLYAKRYLIRHTGRVEQVKLDSAAIEFRTRGKFGMDFLLGPWWHGEGEAFLAPHENRIYGLEHIAPKKVAEREKIRTVFASKLAEKDL